MVPGLTQVLGAGARIKGGSTSVPERGVQGGVLKTEAERLCSDGHYQEPGFPTGRYLQESCQDSQDVPWKNSQAWQALQF